MEVKPPETIYLQLLDSDGEEAEEVTWCMDMINDTDVAYVPRSSYDDLANLLDEPNQSARTHEERVEQLKALIAAAEAWKAEWGWWDNPEDNAAFNEPAAWTGKDDPNMIVRAEPSSTHEEPHT